VATWEDVRELALGLPEVGEGTSWGKPAFKVAGKWFAGESSHEPGALVVRCDPVEAPFMLEARPDVFWVTPHYEGTAYVLVHVEAIDREELAGRLEDAWAIAAPKRLLSESTER
jgi:hypothetical protein